MDKKKLLIYISVFAGLLIFAIAVFFTIRIPSTSVSMSGDAITHYPEENRYEAYVNGLFEKGIYDVTIAYDSESDVSIDMSSNVGGARKFHADNIYLSRYTKKATYNIWLDGKCDTIIIRIRGQEGALNVDSVSITTAWNSKIYNITRLVLWLVLFVIVFLCIIYWEKIRENSLVVLGISVIVVVSSIGIMARYVTVGHDLNFHLMRIEGLKEAFLMGDIPVKVQSNWCFGYGYAVSATYGDITLIVPAIMRILGFTVQSSYKAFVFLMNLGTALTAFFCFNKIGKGQKGIALLATFLYVCAPYRMCCMYIRGAVGEYSGMLFIPLIIYGLYDAYSKNPDDEDYGRSLIVPVIGFAGLVQTHLVSCVMLAIFMFAYMLANLKKTLNRNTFFYLLKTAVFSLVVSLWFLVPMLVFLKEPLRAHTENGYNPDFQLYGLSLAELFAQHSSGSTSFNWAFVSNLSERMSMPVGNGFVVLLLVFAYLRLAGKLNERAKSAGQFAVLGIFAAYMATNLFPYDAIEKTIPLVSKVITRVNVPYRYITMATVAFSVFTVFFITSIKKKTYKKYMLSIFIVTLLVAGEQSLDYAYKDLYYGSIRIFSDDISLNTNDLIGYEYLYEGTDHTRAEYERDITGNNVNYQNEKRNANRFELTVTDTGDNGYLDFPLYYYPGYEAKTTDGSRLDIVRGDNNRIRIPLAAGFNGTVLLRYREPALWRICEIISLLSFAALIVYTKWYTQIRSRFLKAVTKK